jgi:hypothetical protein
MEPHVTLDEVITVSPPLDMDDTGHALHLSPIVEQRV